MMLPHFIFSTITMLPFVQDTRCAEKLQSLGTSIQELVCNFCDEKLFYQDLKLTVRIDRQQR